MHLIRHWGRRGLAMAVGALLATAIGLFLAELPIGRGLIFASYDWLHVFRGEVRADGAVLIYMDEISHQKLQQPLNAPWDRALHAKLIDRLTSAGAKAIVFDVIFSDQGPNPAADRELAEAIKNSARVILAADNVPIGPGANQSIPPIDLLLDAAADIGSAETVPDADVTIRLHTPEDALPALSAAAANFVKSMPIQQASGARWLHYYGPPDWLPWKSYYQALDSSIVPDDFFRDKTVFVGARLMTKFAGDQKDEYRSPYSSFLASAVGRRNQRPFISGVEIQSIAFLNLIRQDWLRALSRSWQLAIIVVFGVLVGAGLVSFRPIWATVAAIALAVLVYVAASILFRKQLVWFPWLILMMQIGGGLAWSVLFNSIQLYVQKRLYEQTLARYLSPKLVRKFSRDPDLLDRPAHKQTVTLLFSDIANFTSLSEGMDSDHLSGLMNRYFDTAVSQCIHKCDGTVVKYIGDAIFAFWNAPEEQPDHQLRACEAALRFRDAPLRWGEKPIHTRIGIHTGVVNVGNFGSADRVDYTALGENVNLASRVEGLNKQLGTTFLVTQATHEAIADKLVTREVGVFRLKGFEKAARVFELVGWPQEAPLSAAWRESFAEGLTLFKKHSLEKAEAAFRRTLELRPDDGPSKFYLRCIPNFRAEPAPAHWTGEIELAEK